jgi:hypothetical protein
MAEGSEKETDYTMSRKDSEIPHDGPPEGKGNQRGADLTQKEYQHWLCNREVVLTCS